MVLHKGRSLIGAAHVGCSMHDVLLDVVDMHLFNLAVDDGLHLSYGIIADVLLHHGLTMLVLVIWI
jgi:hypothetical protein